MEGGEIMDDKEFDRRFDKIADFISKQISDPEYLKKIFGNSNINQVDTLIFCEAYCQNLVRAELKEFLIPLLKEKED